MTLWLTHELLARLVALGEQFAPLETGGILLGWRNGCDHIATGMIGPGPCAMHGRYAFVPDHAWQMAALRRIFSASKGDLDYLGDWHTHPTGPAKMSDEDRSTLRRICRKVATPVMVIVDPSTAVPHVAAWSGARRNLFQIAIDTLRIKPFQAQFHWHSALIE